MATGGGGAGWSACSAGACAAGAVLGGALDCVLCALVCTLGVAAVLLADCA
jgi:hypothetical protein